MASRTIRIGTARAPWGPVRVATTDRGLAGLAVLAPLEAFRADVARRTDGEVAPDSAPLLDRAIAAVEAFLDGSPAELGALPLDLVVRSAWDEAVLGEVRQIGWGQVSSYGGVATAIGRRGAARAVGGAVGRNPIGLAIPATA